MSRDVLKSWNDGAVKESIINFIDSTIEDGPNYIRPEDRIAAFDNDGTLFVEKPMPVQFNFIMKSLISEVENNPSLRNKQPYKAILEKDETLHRMLAQQKIETVLSIVAAYDKIVYGQTPEQYEATVRNFFKTQKPNKCADSYTELVYKPMLELFELLKNYDYRVFICSGSCRDFIHIISEEIYGIYKENIIGTVSEYEYENGVLHKVKDAFGGLVVGPEKVQHIFGRTGRFPIFAAGNANGDIEMLGSARFKLLVNHDDQEREYAYTGGAEEILNIAKKNNYTIISMKNDWNKIF